MLIALLLFVGGVGSMRIRTVSAVPVRDTLPADKGNPRCERRHLT
jgi:hypothetical protein